VEDDGEFWRVGGGDGEPHHFAQSVATSAPASARFMVLRSGVEFQMLRRSIDDGGLDDRQAARQDGGVRGQLEARSRRIRMRKHQRRS